MLECFEDEMLRILCIASIISLIRGVSIEGWENGWKEGISILMTVVFYIVITSCNDLIKEQQLKKIQDRKIYKRVNVIRNGKE